MRTVIEIKCNLRLFLILLTAWAAGGLSGTSARAEDSPGLRILDAYRQDGQMTVVWTGRGGVPNNLLSADTPAGPYTSAVPPSVLTGGKAPWFDVAVTSRLDLATRKFFKIASAAPPVILTAPVLQVPAVHCLDWLPVSWTSPPDSALFQLQTSVNPGFGDQVRESWPLGLAEDISIGQSGDYFTRVRAWNYYPEQGGGFGPWSAVVSNRVFVFRAPELPAAPGSTTNPVITATWAPVPLARIYQFQYSANETFDADVAETWPGDPVENAFLGRDAAFFLRVRAWSDLPERGGVPSDWSALATCVAVVQPAAPVFANVEVAALTVDLDWTDIEAAVIYELRQATNLDFSPSVGYWPSQSHEVGVPNLGGTSQVFRVRAWSNLPESNGVAGHWSAVWQVP